MEKKSLELAVEIPVSVREALGDKATLDLVTWFIKAVPSVAVTREEFSTVLSRLDRVENELRAIREELASFKESVDRRFEAVDRRFEAVNARIDAVHDRIDALRKDMDDRFDSFQKDVSGRIDVIRSDLDSFQRSIEARLDAMNERMLTQARWLVASIAILGTVISILLAIGQFLR